MKLNIIFDIDSCLAEAIRYDEKKNIRLVEENIGKELSDDLLHTAYNYSHYIFPGFYALWEWLHKKGITITVFSSGIKERNIELIEKVAKRSFKNIKEEERPEVKVYSRKDTFNTEHFRDEPDREQYQSYWFGNLKKKLVDVVVTKEELPYSWLVDDDRSYVYANEEKNLIYVTSQFHYFPESDYKDNEEFQSFHKAYYLCGLIDKILKVIEEKNMTPVDAAEYVQATLEGKVIEQDFYFPSRENMQYYRDGLKLLQTIDPTLKMYLHENVRK